MCRLVTWHILAWSEKPSYRFGFDSKTHALGTYFQWLFLFSVTSINHPLHLRVIVYRYTYIFILTVQLTDRMVDDGETGGNFLSWLHGLAQVGQ